MRIVVGMALLVGGALVFGLFLGWLRSRPSFRRDFAQLQESTEAVKVEVGAALLPVFRKMTDAVAKIAR